MNNHSDAPPKQRWGVVAVAVGGVLLWRVAAYYAPSSFGLVLLVANLLSLTAGMVFLFRLFTVDRATRRAARLPLIVTGMVTGSVVALLGAGGALPGVPEAWNLALGAVPVALAVALVFQSTARPRDDAYVDMTCRRTTR